MLQESLVHQHVLDVYQSAQRLRVLIPTAGHSVTTRAQHAAKVDSPRCYSDNHMNHTSFGFDSSPKHLHPICRLLLSIIVYGSAQSCTCHPLSDLTSTLES